jgi:hypothetical protein
LVFSPDESKKRAADDLIHGKFENIVFAYTGAINHSAYTILSRNTSEAEASRKWIAGLD